jgi:hypothetical protein
MWKKAEQVLAIEAFLRETLFPWTICLLTSSTHLSMFEDWFKAAFSLPSIRDQSSPFGFLKMASQSVKFFRKIDACRV